MTNWELGQYVRVWRGGSVGEHDAGGYEYGHIETFDPGWWNRDDGWVTEDDGCVIQRPDSEVMLVGDDGKEIYCRVKDLEEE